LIPELPNQILTSNELSNRLSDELGFITVSFENFGIHPSKQNYLLRYSYVDITGDGGEPIDVWGEGDEILLIAYYS
jgi:hypothetical protein